MIRFKVQSQPVRFSVKGTGALKMQVDPAVVVYTGGEPYEGEYEVTPTVDGTVLKTKDKLLADDVTVKAIPYYDTGNTAGGRTIYIANEV